ncbi:hypothetical protein IMZ29_00835 [Achromobacter sp. GG226]|uniref:hypothetical protein n=1 Tax=Verticiella alkaliphila TaxID=2779529 RepID=UPI001C0CD0AB|nr:hypothetical protein [Verticiella sp. GG226]MBU4609148.1 hypothetical protein [Verticiella sp. GG226]
MKDIDPDVAAYLGRAVLCMDESGKRDFYPADPGGNAAWCGGTYAGAGPRLEALGLATVGLSGRIHLTSDALSIGEQWVLIQQSL